MKRIRNLAGGWVSMKETVQDPVAITLFMSEADAYKLRSALETLDHADLLVGYKAQDLLAKLIDAFPKPPKEEPYETEPYVCGCVALHDTFPGELYRPCPKHPGRFIQAEWLKRFYTQVPEGFRTGQYYRDQAKSDKMVGDKGTLRWDSYNQDELQKLCEETHPGFLKANDDSNKAAGKVVRDEVKEHCTEPGANWFFANHPANEMQGAPNISPGSTVDPISVIREAFFEVARKLGHDRCGNQRKE
jgi:hypothetical protein